MIASLRQTTSWLIGVEANDEASVESKVKRREKEEGKRCRMRFQKLRNVIIKLVVG